MVRYCCVAADAARTPGWLARGMLTRTPRRRMVSAGVGAAAVVASLVGVANLSSRPVKSPYVYSTMAKAMLSRVDAGGPAAPSAAAAVTGSSLWKDRGAVVLAIRRPG